MKNLIKKALTIMSALTVVFVMVGCSSNSTSDVKAARHVRYVQTHENSDVRTVKAQMYQKNGNKSRMGEIKFHETDAGLKMTAELYDVRPGNKYSLELYKLKDCDMSKKDNKELFVKSCTKEKCDSELPEMIGDKNGKIDASFLITGMSAADIDHNKLILVRDGNHVGWGHLKEGFNW